MTDCRTDERADVRWYGSNMEILYEAKGKSFRNSKRNSFKNPKLYIIKKTSPSPMDKGRNETLDNISVKN